MALGLVKKLFAKPEVQAMLKQSAKSKHHGCRRICRWNEKENLKH
jgi:hypothetical protein